MKRLKPTVCLFLKYTTLSPPVTGFMFKTSKLFPKAAKHLVCLFFLTNLCTDRGKGCISRCIFSHGSIHIRCFSKHF